MKSVLISSIIRRWDRYVPPMLDSVLTQTYENVAFNIFVSSESRVPIQNYIDENHPQKRNQLIFGVAPVREDEIAVKKWCTELFSTNAQKYDYFTLVDGDDVIEKNYIEVLLNLAEKENAEISCAGTWHHNKGLNYINTSRTVSECKLFSIKDNLDDLHLFMPHCFCFWGVLFKSTLVPENLYDLFPKGEETGYNGADSARALVLIERATKLAVAKDVGYHYFIYENSLTRTFLPGRENVGWRLYEIYMNTLKKYGEITSENRAFVIHECGGCNLLALMVLFDDQKISPEEKFEKAHFMFTCDMMKEIISELPTPLYKGFVRQYDRVLQFFKEGLLELTQEKKEKLYEIFLVLWWRYEGRVSFDVYEEFLFQGRFIDSLAKDPDHSFTEGILLEIEKRENDLENFKNQVAKFLDKGK